MTLAPLLPRSAHKVRPIKVLIQEGLGFARDRFGNRAGGDLLAARNQHVANAGSFRQKRNIIHRGQGLPRLGQALPKSREQQHAVFEGHNPGALIVFALPGDVNLPAAQFALYQRIEQHMSAMLRAVRNLTLPHPVTPLISVNPPDGTLAGEIADETLRRGKSRTYPQLTLCVFSHERGRG